MLLYFDDICIYLYDINFFLYSFNQKIKQRKTTQKLILLLWSLIKPSKVFIYIIIIIIVIITNFFQSIEITPHNLLILIKKK